MSGQEQATVIAQPCQRAIHGLVATIGIALVLAVASCAPASAPPETSTVAPTAALAEAEPRLIVTFEKGTADGSVTVPPGGTAAVPLPKPGQGCCYDVEVALPRGYDTANLQVALAPESFAIAMNSMATKPTERGTSHLFALAVAGTRREGPSVVGTPVPGVVTIDVLGVKKPDGSPALLRFVLDCGRADGSGDHGEARPGATTALMETERLLGDLRGRGFEVGALTEASSALIEPEARKLREQGITPKAPPEFGFRVEPFLDAPRSAWQIGKSRLYLFEYADARAAYATSTGVPPDAQYGTWDWGAEASYFRFGSVIAFQAGRDAEVSRALLELCGSPFAFARSAFSGGEGTTPRKVEATLWTLVQ
jgi:hypothetical protein